MLRGAEAQYFLPFLQLSVKMPSVWAIRRGYTGLITFKCCAQGTYIHHLLTPANIIQYDAIVGQLAARCTQRRPRCSDGVLYINIHTSCRRGCIYWTAVVKTVQDYLPKLSIVPPLKRHGRERSGRCGAAGQDSKSQAGREQRPLCDMSSPCTQRTW